ncbi:hypothetical protein [Gracilibacillus timonensis]|uniref:hypothetical protein n=1 Tax=Gracilibacillus timonensis TaxID=1816696 RepID=UPI000825C535|nr:hypothetical protein [Gracilibacillus timonensis]
MRNKTLYSFVVLILLSMLMVACQESSSETAPSSEPAQDSSTEQDKDQANTDSQATDNDEENQPNNNQEESSEEQAVASDKEENETKTEPSSHDSSQEKQIHETNYASEQKAMNRLGLESYREVEDTNINLGHGIEGFAEGAAGHTYISWNEGKWLIEVDAPTDPSYMVANYEDDEALAKAVVDYLEDNYLPAPDQRGIIEINAFNEHPQTTIKWQKGSTVYMIDEKVPDPLTALEIAVNQG